MKLRTEAKMEKVKLTKAQRAALVEAAGPRKHIHGMPFGGGRVSADTRVERALIRMGLAKGLGGYPFRGSAVYITDAGRAAVAEK